MGDLTRHSAKETVWKLEARQHGVIAHRQLRELGVSDKAIKHRVARGRLHPVDGASRGVYAVGRPEIDRRGRWMAAILSCGPTAVLSHQAAAAHWGFAPRGLPGGGGRGAPLPPPKAWGGGRIRRG